MSLDAFQTGLKNLLMLDTGLSGWVAAHFPGKKFTEVEGNVPVKQVAQALLPVFIFELGDSNYEYDVIGAASMVAQSEIYVAVLWSEESRSKAFTQRKTLPGIFATALLQSPTLSGAVAAAQLVKVEPDRGINHPAQLMRFTVRGEYRVLK